MRTAAAALASARPQLRLVVLFGSLARGDALPDSDADIAVLGAESWDGLGLGSQLAGVAGREPHVVELEHASDLLRYHVARDGVLLYEAEPYTWARFQAESALRYFDLAPIIALCTEGARQRLIREAKRG